MNARFALRTPAGVGAIAAVDLAGDVDAALTALGIAHVGVGEVRLRDLGGVDRGVVARWGEDACTLMPHGGIAVMRAVCDTLRARGITPAAFAPCEAFPEAADAVEALTLHALTHAESPRAVDLLLDQPRRWRAWKGEPPLAALRERATTLRHLLRAPVVAVVGRTNIGKSTLLNALAGRDVSIVHDAPGVTRDHVGASLALDGLAVRWLDTPGLRAEGGPTDEEEREALEAALDAAHGADLLVVCADSSSGWPDLASLGLEGRPALRVGLRADLGRVDGAEVSTAAGGGAGEGLEALAVAVRRALAPDEALADPSPWLFDGALAGTLSFPPETEWAPE